ncbi:hypothetical protein ESZ53_07715 [Salinibacterium sp. UTAS2018]|uniref:hypothetical protein n=1 Tax=Salinibacterium sp. UTAS2018 TaxID=2508880 RepID=UPI00100974CD|nr:hypothetical protein [Salinibacterium sp. UTAS2018]QAV70339.1 hypothetical protein ESZ53_07715 [Salinibacterium sp. UTAS2018]
MTSSRQNAASIAVIFALSVSLSGCALVGGAGQLWDAAASDLSHQRALDAAAVELESIAGVRSASARFASDTPESAAAELHVVVADNLSRDQVRRIAAVARETFTSVDFETAAPLLTLSAAHDGAGVLSRSSFEFSDENFADDVAYWRAAESAVEADLSMALTASMSGALYDRTITWPDGEDALATADSVIANFTALAAVPDDTSSPTMWNFSGMWAYPSLPAADTVALLDEIRGTIPLADFSADSSGMGEEYPEGVQLQLQATMREGTVLTQASIAVNHNEYREADWQNVVAAGVLASRVPDLNFSYTEKGRQFLIHTSACTVTSAESSQDRQLFDAVLASGAEFLPGAGPGACIPEQ